jgi:hypothetical protein
VIEYLEFLDTTVELDVDDAALPAFVGVRRFFRHLLRLASDTVPTFRVLVSVYRPERDVPDDVWRGELVDIRRSSAPEFTFAAHLVDDGDRRLYVNRTTWLSTPRDVRTDNTFALRVTSGSTVQVIDFLRDLVIRHQEQLGTVVLHASGAAGTDGVVAVAGPKGAGKTTTLLSVLSRPGWSYFTGDKMFCRITTAGVQVLPWRDYPYVGVGTILADDRLTELVSREVGSGVLSRPAKDKILLDPDLFESWLGGSFDPAPRPLRALFLPQVGPGLPLRVEPLVAPNERWAQLQKAIDRQADTSFFTWQSYLVPDYTPFFASLVRLHEALADVPVVRLTGTLDIDADAVLAIVGAAPEHVPVGGGAA